MNPRASFHRPAESAGVNPSAIRVAQPVLNGRERAYVLDCLDKNQLSGGEYVERFEAALAEFCEAKYAVACCNGTAALHLALMALGTVRPAQDGVGLGDEVIVPTLTFVATANAVCYCGATPVFVDSDPANWCIDPAQIETRVTAKARAIIAVHLYGHPADMDAINEIAERHHLDVIEDAAEAHGALYKNRKTGSLGHAAAFSFFGNKILTTGEGGAVVTNDPAVAERARFLRGQGTPSTRGETMEPARRYWFTEIGYNYRMTELQAAIGLGQMECADWHVARREIVAAWYRDFLGAASPAVTMQPESGWAWGAHWMNTVVLGDSVRLSRDEVMDRLSAEGIETRPVFTPMHRLPMYQSEDLFPVAERLAERGINLPSHAALSCEDVQRVCETLLVILGASEL